jgi:hypothetical protein
MTQINVQTIDSKVWELTTVYELIAQCMAKNQDFTINLNNEGPDFFLLDIDQYIVKLASVFKYDINRIKIKTANLIEKANKYNVEIIFPSHLISNTLEYQYSIDKSNITKTFGLFINRNNSYRLSLSTYLYKNYFNKIEHTNHLNVNNIFHLKNLGLEGLIAEYGTDNLISIVEYIQQCPIADHTVVVDKTLNKDPAQQLLAVDKNDFLKKYNNFFVELVCESYFSGNTFFPTEKTWRPILLKTPFIIFGSKNYLYYLRKMGFRTFSDFWDEDYDGYDCKDRFDKIINLIEWLGKLSTSKLESMYWDMQYTLDHNYDLLINKTFNRTIVPL